MKKCYVNILDSENIWIWITKSWSEVLELKEYKHLLFHLEVKAYMDV
jgi:hypothetical protein